MFKRLHVIEFKPAGEPEWIPGDRTILFNTDHVSEVSESTEGGTVLRMSSGNSYVALISFDDFYTQYIPH